MSKTCPSCGKILPDDASFCDGCGAHQPPVQPVSPGVYSYPPVSVHKYTWIDAATVIGFVSSVVGLFWCAVLLLPIGGVASGIGFRGERLKGLAISGLVISIVGIIIRLCTILYQSGILPRWFTMGVL